MHHGDDVTHVFRRHETARDAQEQKRHDGEYAREGAQRRYAVVQGQVDRSEKMSRYPTKGAIKGGEQLMQDAFVMIARLEQYSA